MAGAVLLLHFDHHFLELFVLSGKGQVFVEDVVHFQRAYLQLLVGDPNVFNFVFEGVLFPVQSLHFLLQSADAVSLDSRLLLQFLDDVALLHYDLGLHAHLSHALLLSGNALQAHRALQFQLVLNRVQVFQLLLQVLLVVHFFSLFSWPVSSAFFLGFSNEFPLLLEVGDLLLEELQALNDPVLEVLGIQFEVHVEKSADFHQLKENSLLKLLFSLAFLLDQLRYKILNYLELCENGGVLVQ